MSMAGTGTLVDVVDDFVRELDEIESVFANHRGARTVEGFQFAYTPAEDGCLVSLWDSWNRLVRTLVICSAVGSVSGLSGNVYTPTTSRSESQVLFDLIANRKGNNFRINNGEPAWADPSCLADIVTFLGLQNANTIVSAVGSTTVLLGPVAVPNPLKEIRLCRNFVAHKSQPTLNDVLAFARSPFINLSTHLRERRSGVEAFSEWKDCLAALASSAAF
jgi:hypothetical protein